MVRAARLSPQPGLDCGKGPCADRRRAVRAGSVQCDGPRCDVHAQLPPGAMLLCPNGERSLLLMSAAQGMSISSCTNCSFINTIFSNTSGTWPKCGVDVSLAAPFASSKAQKQLLAAQIEPSGCGKSQELRPGVWHQGCSLQSIIFQNCTADYNDGCGFSIDPGGRDLTIAFEDCKLHGNHGASFMIDSERPQRSVLDGVCGVSDRHCLWFVCRHGAAVEHL